ncbi:MAG TPA: PQQ-binding-like beta-propeller repeat protein [Jatrophihabitantaceae bacterium]|nr:PQQ-binding-like beta-propeller repeat protein [Jatrophihabitantaceae bacterium]
MRVRGVVACAVGAALLTACTSSGSDRSSSNAAQSSAPVTSATHTVAPPTGAVDWPMYHGDLTRTGVSSTMLPAKGDPKVVRSLDLDAAVYASPIVVDATVYVATENDSVYAFTTSGGRKWRTNLGKPSPGSERPCGNIDPLGITGTPVYDAGSKTVFVAAEYGGPVRHELVALDATSGKVRWRKNIDLPGADPTVMQQRGALVVAAGRVWVAFGGLAGDCGDYKGRVVGVPVDNGGATLAYTVPTTREAGIWAPPGPSVDASGDLFVAVGNGESGPGDKYDFSDSVLRIDPMSANLLDSFSPSNWADHNAGDQDLGSQGPTLVGDWVFIAGKSGDGYVLRKDHLGGIGGEVSQSRLCSSFGGTAVAGDVVYVPCSEGVRAIRIDGNGRIHELWQTGGNIAGSPVVGGGRVWTLETGSGVLHGLDPRTGRALGTVHVGETSRFATPALYGNLVLVPTLRGLVIVSTS